MVVVTATVTEIMEVMETPTPQKIMGLNVVVSCLICIYKREYIDIYIYIIQLHQYKRLFYSAYLLCYVLKTSHVNW